MFIKIAISLIIYTVRKKILYKIPNCYNQKLCALFYIHCKYTVLQFYLLSMVPAFLQNILWLEIHWAINSVNISALSCCPFSLLSILFILTTYFIVRSLFSGTGAAAGHLLNWLVRNFSAIQMLNI